MLITITKSSICFDGSYTQSCKSVVFEQLAYKNIKGLSMDGLAETQEINLLIEQWSLTFSIGANSKLELFHDRAEIDGHPVMMYGQIVTWLEWFAELMSNKV
jgi:transcriptional regulator of nitric oxide reductase